MNPWWCVVKKGGAKEVLCVCGCGAQVDVASGRLLQETLPGLGWVWIGAKNGWACAGCEVIDNGQLIMDNEERRATDE